MHTLIVHTHPDSASLTHAIAHQIAHHAGAASGDSVELADLAAEGFDPRYNAGDVSAYKGNAAVPADVLAEQARLDRADTLVLVFPVYWWSMPAQLKGWIDRVFSNGWAYAQGADGKVAKKLQHLKVHLVALGGADERTWQRRHYTDAMKTQIDTGIFDYCGAPVLSSTVLMDVESGQAAPLLDQAAQIGRSLHLTRTNEVASV